jgi:uncharacterized membrane protein
MPQKNISRKDLVWRYGFAIITIIVGATLSYLNMGNEFLGFSSVGTWLIYVGFVMLAVITLHNKKRIVDERMLFVATKASRITFVGIILFAFIVMVIDGVKPIGVAYSIFMSYFICGIVLLYLVSYKILLRYN